MTKFKFLQTREYSFYSILFELRNDMTLFDQCQINIENEHVCEQCPKCDDLLCVVIDLSNEYPDKCVARTFCSQT